MMLAQELSERDHANRRAISAEILEQVPAAAVLLSSDEDHCHISGAFIKAVLYVLVRNIHNFLLDIFFHFLYLFKMWEIFMPHSVYSQQNIRCTRDIKHCLLETFPALVCHNTLRGADNTANCQLLGKHWGCVKYKILKVSS